MTATMPKNYSQNNEQASILAACADIHNGRFLDIGAFHPEVFSNTRALFELGWRGVLVEPSPNCVAGLAQAYNGVEGMAIVAAACRPAGDCGMYEMQITNDAVSTQDAGNAERWRERGGFYGRIYIPSVTIPGLLNQFGSFDFVNIDAEGGSVSLFEDLMKTEMFPRCVCVEHDGRTGEVLQMANSRGYKEIYWSGENVVFSRE